MARFSFRTTTPWFALTAGLLFAGLFGLALPPVDLWPLVFLAPAPLAMLAWRRGSPSRAASRLGIEDFAQHRSETCATAGEGGDAILAGLGTLPLWLFHQRWLIDVTLVGYPLVCVYLAVYPALFVWIGGRLSRRLGGGLGLALALAALWTGLEFLRGSIAFTGYPWFLLAHPLIETPGAQVAAWLGAYAVSFTVALGGIALGLALAPGAERVARVRIAALAIVALSASQIAGALRPAPKALADSPSLRVAVIQTNVPQSNKMAWSLEQRLEDFREFAGLTRLADDAEPPPDLIVWPETMFPGLTLSPEAAAEQRQAGLRFQNGTPATVFYDALLSLQEELSAPMLVGAFGYDGLQIERLENGGVSLNHEGKYNSAFLIQEARVEQRYDKQLLTPFGETMPYISWSDWLESKLLALGAPGMAFDLSAGETPVVFETPGWRVVTPICFEAATPRVCRRLVYGAGRRRADLMVNLTNDGWFGRWIGGREQHLQVARWRCVELGVPMVRAANTGISAAIDRRGRLIKAGPDDRDKAVGAAGVMRVELDRPGSQNQTLYGVIGDAFGWLSLVVAAGLTVAALAPVRRFKSR